MQTDKANLKKKAKRYFGIIINTIASLGGALTTAVSISVLLGPGSIVGYLVGITMAACGLAANLISFSINISSEENKAKAQQTIKFDDENHPLVNSILSLTVLIFVISAISSGIFAYMGFMALSSMLTLPIPLIAYQVTATISAIAATLSSLVFNEIYIYKFTDRVFANSRYISKSDNTANQNPHYAMVSALTPLNEQTGNCSRSESTLSNLNTREPGTDHLQKSSANIELKYSNL